MLVTLDGVATPLLSSKLVAAAASEHGGCGNVPCITHRRI